MVLVQLQNKIMNLPELPNELTFLYLIAPNI